MEVLHAGVHYIRYCDLYLPVFARGRVAEAIVSLEADVQLPFEAPASRPVDLSLREDGRLVTEGGEPAVVSCESIFEHEFAVVGLDYFLTGGLESVIVETAGLANLLASVFVGAVAVLD